MLVGTRPECKVQELTAERELDRNFARLIYCRNRRRELVMGGFQREGGIPDGKIVREDFGYKYAPQAGGRLFSTRVPREAHRLRW